ncbi:hypothetical protein [Streptomyces cyaneofuscatus]|uniref:hypothetical protein n=1 Tax=Streptomyces cyaneofuscatus TaxID=66883 RepID=UPI0033A32896
MLKRLRVPGRTTDDGPAPPFWRQRGWRFSAGFTVLAVAAGLITLGVRGAGTALPRAELDASKPLVKAAAPGGPEAGRAAGRPDGCSTDDRVASLPRSAPTDVTWRQVAGVDVPTSASAGPLLAGGSLWWCFARTPMGAVMAAHVVPVKLGDAGWRAVAERQTVPGRARNFLVSKRSRLPDEASVRGAGSFAGFAVPSFSPSEARVDLLVRNGQGGLFTTTVSLVWSEGDWKVVPRPDGTLSGSLAPVQGSRGFVMWKV